MTIANLGIAVQSGDAKTASVDLDKLTAAAGRAEAGVTRLASASVKTAQATQQISLNSANIAAQLQDVAVSAQMGMSPLSIALQQGTQLSAALGNQGLKGTVAALGGAFTSILNPVSLATIGIIGLGTFGIQALSGLIGETESATDAFERHGDELRRIVAGYDEADDVLKDFAETMGRLPREAVQIQLGAQLREMNEQIDAFEAKSASLGKVLSGSLNETDREVGGLLTRFADAELSAGDLVIELTRLENADLGPLSFAIKGLVADLLNGAQQAAAFEQSLVAISHALAATGWNEGTSIGLNSMIEGQRSAELHKIELDALNAKTPAQQRDIAMRRERLKLADEEISEALREQKIREAGELAFARANAKAGKSATKDLNQWANSTESFEQRIKQQELEASLLGQTTYEVERQKAALDLLGEAKRADIEITPEVTAQIETMAGKYADAALALEGAKLEMDNRGPFDAMGDEIANLNDMLDRGAISWATYQAAMGKVAFGAANDVLGSLSQITGALSSAFEDNKALAVANAVVNTAQGITKALAEGGPFGFPIAAAIGIAGAAQIATILGAKPGSSNAPSVSSSAPASGGASGAAQPTMPTAYLEFRSSRGRGWSDEDVEDLMRQIVGKQRDGYQLVLKGS